MDGADRRVELSEEGRKAEEMGTQRSTGENDQSADPLMLSGGEAKGKTNNEPNTAR